MSLQRLILTFKPKEIILHLLYSKQDGPNPGTKARAREVVDLTRSGLQNALRTLEEGVEVIGTSGYEIREETISVDVVRK